MTAPSAEALEAYREAHAEARRLYDHELATRPYRERRPLWLWQERTHALSIDATVAPWRAKLAEQCGKTLAVQHEREAAYRRGIEDAEADAGNDRAYIASLKAAISQLCDIIGVERGSDNWPEFVLRARAARALAPPQEGLSAFTSAPDWESDER